MQLQSEHVGIAGCAPTTAVPGMCGSTAFVKARSESSARLRTGIEEITQPRASLPERAACRSDTMSPSRA
jgi:hypothetical protein